MLERPAGVSDDEVAAAVRRGWGVDGGRAEFLPVGFGAHHWRVGDLFVTLDELGVRHDEASLESAYAAAAALGFDFVVAPLPAAAGGYTVALGDGRLSCTRWVEGDDGPGARAEVLGALARLHAAEPPPAILPWRRPAMPHVPPGPWDGGPLGEQAREAVTARLADIERWTARYRRLLAAAKSRPWVPTHGEPHDRNQIVTPDGLRFVDWESLALPPRERDLKPLIEGGYELEPDWEMVELFSLEWRLDEIAQYAAWFAAPHTGGTDDRIAFGGLLEELERDELRAPSGP
jgi:spectinomycin phosphotransferase